VGNTGMSSGTGVIVGSNFTVAASQAGGGTACVNTQCISGAGAATGAFYGPNAQHAGGVWQVIVPTYGNANGVFQGSK
jgi:predicted RecA/RadA family phage recombinase